MAAEAVRRLLEQVAAGTTSVEQAVATLRHLPYEPLAEGGVTYARLDHHRPLRQGMGEVVYCPGKGPAQVAAIAARIVAQSGRLLATRATPEDFAAVAERLGAAHYHEAARIITVGDGVDGVGEICLLAAGTADLAVAEEARVVAEWLGSRVTPLYDVGVAGLHRLLAHLPNLHAARVVVAVAGMDGALPTVAAGLTDRPLIAVPTATGYGASFAGLAPLLTMLNACAPGIGVVNIDNGFGAACLAHRINLLGEGGSPARERA
ncbi:MAG: 1-(5-phosphoribosyl)-5-amino-4-imidazole-carboxylate carboxylase [Nitrospirae bacterium CG18_big_fil_WC_8_21_14_2_50_70_55]|nr:nickel pincer cofactor biosynthesis protein LarB [Deltaproteobacteria bacterium]OIP62441.1 MAG: 1-(5-phosphoribosyl)-5-amino-4-imidazole-carboxylate carboxylase [Nitrospirae bacterium CG2_30_70_394]PIQ07130.1 MAG: 1-(5-phosphoribosyl)-5-amino-4-imidazole-carboxylate carboxylase [Nitrospirae bacterium CG18_big_fil_WC_8_21_14_2_50_70_55]PIU77481.1 MAG: 1-(5-phosphoribosyl)-5-amino-4-imidazole-carboxylate carboxylase [Nitrospirae bacterium CG06_land_8_20_14_3_00_70_43]PIW82951.1 MAG: 1-(5-phosp